MAPQPREPPILCKKCNLEFPNYDAFHQHKRASSQHITCQFCGKDFQTRKACARHQLQNHAATQNLSCATCGKTFPRLGGLVGHLEQGGCGDVDGMTFKAKYEERKTHYDNMRNVTQLHEFGPTSGNFANEPENQARGASSLGSHEASSANGGPVNRNATTSPSRSRLMNPATPAAATGPVFKTSVPILNPIYHPPPIDLLSEEPLPVDPTMLPRADEDLISFDVTGRVYETIYAQEILKAPLTMKTSEVRAIAIDKAKAYIAKKEEDLKSEMMSVKSAAAKQAEKPTSTRMKVVAAVKPAEFPQLPLEQFKNGGLNQPNIIDAAVKDPTAGNAWGAKKNLFPNAPPAVAPPTELLASMTIDKPEIEGGTRYDRYDPTNPMFNASEFWVQVLEKYKCPIPLCNKSFEKLGAFRNHLNSQAHVNGRFKCRNCCRYFKTAGALSQHSESPGGVRCDVRDTDQYNLSVDEFAASHVTIAGKHADNTIKYAVVNKNSAPFKERKAVQEAASKAHEDDYNSYWSRNRPQW